MGKSKKQQTRPSDADDEMALYDEMMEVAAATECTGLMPTPPTKQSEVDSYENIFDVPLAKDEQAAHDHGKTKVEKH